MLALFITTTPCPASSGPFPAAHEEAFRFAGNYSRQVDARKAALSLGTVGGSYRIFQSGATLGRLLESGCVAYSDADPSCIVLKPDAEAR